jgi:hypothetical protein
MRIESEADHVAAPPYAALAGRESRPAWRTPSSPGSRQPPRLQDPTTPAPLSDRQAFVLVEGLARARAIVGVSRLRQCQRQAVDVVPGGHVGHRRPISPGPGRR